MIKITDDMVDRAVRANYERHNPSDNYDDEPLKFKNQWRDQVRQTLTDALAETPVDIQWRDLALQFDAHRIEAMGIIRAMVSGLGHTDMAKAFLKLAPLSGKDILDIRIASMLAAEGRTRYYAVQSVSGSHIGLWTDRAVAIEVLRDYPGGTFLELVTCIG